MRGTRKVQNIVDALTKEEHKIAADGGTHDTTLLPMTTYQPVRVTTADGKVVSGILKNEDSFSLQVLGRDDLNLYRFKRQDVKVFYDPQSLMPHDWDKRLRRRSFRICWRFSRASTCRRLRRLRRAAAARRWDRESEEDGSQEA